MFRGTVDCPHARDCPGCPLIHLSYEDGLSAKRERLAGTVGRFPELAGLDVRPARPAEPVVGYRARAKLVVDGRRAGLYARASHDVVDIPGCRVIDPGAGVIVERLRSALPAPFPLFAIDVRRVGDRFLLTLVVGERADESRVRSFAEDLARRDSSLLGVAMSRRADLSPRVLGGAPKVLVGPSQVPRRIRSDGPFHYTTHGAFTQAHPEQERSLLSDIAAEIDRAVGGVRGTTVLELFAGAAALGLDLAAGGARVTSVESFGPVALLARDAAREQNLEVSVESGDAEGVVRRFRAEARRFDVAVVNPPRRGLSASLRADLVALAPRAIVYVSCEPATLARDVADFRRLGFSARTLAPYDMMPLTEEVETLAVLEPCEIPAAEVIHADETLIAVVKSPHEPTTPEGEHRGSLLDRVRRMSGAESAVLVHGLDAGASGICLFARRPELAAELGHALAQGRKEYTALVRGIARKRGNIGKSRSEGARATSSEIRYQRLRVVGGHSLVRVFSERGKKQQIRRHLGSIGHPVVGDSRYGDDGTNRHFFAQCFLDRPFLHCDFVRLETPSALELVSPLAPDLELCLEELGRAR